MRHALLATVLAAATLAAAAPAAAQAALAPGAALLDQLVAKYEAVAFGFEHTDGGDRLRRWEGPAHVELRGAPEHRAPLQSVIDDLHGLTGLAIDVVAADGDIVVRLLDNRSYWRTARSAGFPRFTACFGMVRYVVPSFRLIGADVVVNGDDPPGNILSCLNEELLQAITGLANDSELPPKPSLFSDRDEYPGISGSDRLLVRAHFDPRLHPGQTREEALPLVRVILEELLRE